MRVSDYRLRLFLSVDLAGSTAFKAGRGRLPANSNSPHPLWIVVIRKFYEAFPSALEKYYNRRRSQQDNWPDANTSPQSWKTVGDEIIFCCRVMDNAHLHLCVLAFIDALKDYGRTLETDQHHLDVKGTAWIAAFPAINMTATRRGLTKSDYLQEDFEANADSKPGDFDFLGPEIDAGFRLATYSTIDRCAISFQLAWLLTRNPGSNWNSEPFLYFGRQNLKGVIDNRPYPMVYLITERHETRAELRRKETKILGQANFIVSDIHNYLTDFMMIEGLEFPLLSNSSVVFSLDDMPISYKQFQVQAKAELKAIIEQENQLAKSGDAEDTASDQAEMPSAIIDAAHTYQQTQNDVVSGASAIPSDEPKENDTVPK